MECGGRGRIRTCTSEEHGFTGRWATYCPTRPWGRSTGIEPPAFRATTWRADHYTMNAAPSEGVEPPLSLCKSGALPLRQPGLNRLGIPGRIRTCDSRFVVWNDLRFTTGTRLAGLTLRRRDSNSDQLVNSQRSCRWTTPECEVPRLAAHRAVAHGEPSWRGADSNRYYPAYETGVLPLDDRAVTLDGSDPSSPA